MDEEDAEAACSVSGRPLRFCACPRCCAEADADRAYDEGFCWDDSEDIDIEEDDE